MPVFEDATNDCRVFSSTAINTVVRVCARAQYLHSDVTAGRAR